MLVSRLFEKRDLLFESIDGWNGFYGNGFYISPVSSGENVNYRSAMGVSGVYSCVRVLSDDVAKLPLPLYKKTTNGREQVTDHAVNYVLNVRPNPYMTPFVFRKLMEVHRLLWGNAYAVPVWDSNGNLESIWPLSPAATVPYIEPMTGEVWYVTLLLNGEYRKFHEESVIHLKGFTEDGITGIPVIQHAREAIGTERAAQKFSGSFYSKGAKPSGVLEVPTMLQGPAKDKIRAEFERMTSGLDNVHRVAVLDLGQKYTPISMPLKDAQYVESRQWNLHDISRYFGVPLYKLNEGKESYNSNEQQSIDYVVSTVTPIITQYEQELTYKLLTDRELKKYYLKHNLASVLRGDNASRAAYYEKMIQSGVYSINDVLELEDKNTIEGGDVHLASLNYAPLHYLEEYQKAKAGIGGENKNE